MRKKGNESLQMEDWSLEENVGKKISDRSLTVDLVLTKNKIVGMDEMSLTSVEGSSSSRTENLKERLMRSRDSVIRNEWNKRLLENLEEDDSNEKVITEGLVSIVGLIIQTIKDLSSKLVTVYRELARERNRGESREFEIDRLRAMIRASSGDSEEYRRRIQEIEEFAQRVSQETLFLRNIKQSNDVDLELSSETNEKKINGLKSLMNELRVKLRNDRKALFTGGNEWYSIYVKKIEVLKALAESVLPRLGAAGSSLKFGTCIEVSKMPVCRNNKGITETEQLLRRVACELESLARMPVKIGPRIGIESCAGYTKRIKSLEKLVGSSITLIEKLIVWSRGNNERFERTEETGWINDSRYRESIDSFEALVKKLILGIKKLEMVVAAGDGAYLLEKIRHLEISVKRLRAELENKEEDKSSLILELSGAKIAYGEKSEELDRMKKKYDKVASRMRKRGEPVDYDEKMTIVLEELENSRIEANAFRNEVNQLKPEAERMRSERKKLVEEVERLRGVAEEKEEAIGKMTKERRNREKVLTRETIEVRTKLTSAEAEIKCLKREISDLKEDKQLRDSEASVELKNLKSSLKNARESLDSKNHEYANLESNLNEIKIDKAKVEQELSCVQTQNEILAVSLNSEIEKHTRTQKDLKKLAADFRSVSDDFSKVEAEKKNVQKSLEDTEREKNRLRSEFDDCHRRNVTLRSESSSLKAKLKELEHELEEARAKGREVEERFKKINEQRKDGATRLETLSRENEKLKDDLDKLRFDKLNMISALNDLKYNFEAKTQEAANIEEKWKVKLIDLERLRESENGARLEVEKLRGTTIELRESIERVNLEKARVEEHLGAMRNDFGALEHKMSILKTERDALAQDSSSMNERMKELTEEITTLRNATENNIRERLELVTEHESALAALGKKLSELEEERARLASDLSALREENAALKRDYEEIIRENEKMQLGGKKNEMERLIDENEALKVQLSKLRIFVSEEDREVAKSEMEKLCSELVKIRAENTSLKKLRNRRRFLEELSSPATRDYSRKLEEELRLCKSDKESLRRSLEIARNKIAINEERSKEDETKINMLMGSIEGLKERYKISRREFEDARLRNEKLDSEMSELRKYLEAMKTENHELMRELQNLRRDSATLNDEHSRTARMLAEHESELVALKDELAKLRGENLSLSAQLEAKNADSRCLETENSSLRNELEAARCAKTSALEETNELRSEREKLVTLRATLENKLIDAQREISKYVLATEKLNNFENKLKTVLKSYIITKKLLRSANEEISHLRRFANSRFQQTFHYKEKIRAT